MTEVFVGQLVFLGFIFLLKKKKTNKSDIKNLFHEVGRKYLRIQVNKSKYVYPRSINQNNGLNIFFILLNQH